jgi:hypothetical protein
VTREDNGPGDRAYVITDVVGSVNPGDRVVLNTTAVELGLGTGGWHFVHWNLERSELDQPGPGHIMKMRYTSLQADVGAAEESITPVDDLGGMPVIACTLLSQAAAAAAAFRAEKPDARIALLMTDQASLPIVISDLVHQLRSVGLIDLTITAGHAFGGDLEAVNVASGLAIARASGVDMTVVSEGLGVAGTGSTFGFSGFEMASVVNTVRTMNGRPVIAVRFSDADERDRHQGISHHTRTILRHCEGASVAIPFGEPVDDRETHHMVQVDVSLEPVVAGLGRHGITLTTMGRTVEQDKRFFLYAAAAGVAAARLYDHP